MRLSMLAIALCCFIAASFAALDDPHVCGTASPTEHCPDLLRDPGHELLAVLLAATGLGLVILAAVAGRGAGRDHIRILGTGLVAIGAAVALAGSSYVLVRAQLIKNEMRAMAPNLTISSLDRAAYRLDARYLESLTQDRPVMVGGMISAFGLLLLAVRRPPGEAPRS